MSQHKDFCCPVSSSRLTSRHSVSVCESLGSIYLSYIFISVKLIASRTVCTFLSFTHFQKHLSMCATCSRGGTLATGHCSKFGQRQGSSCTVRYSKVLTHRLCGNMAGELQRPWASQGQGARSTDRCSGHTQAIHFSTFPSSQLWVMTCTECYVWHLPCIFSLSPCDGLPKWSLPALCQDEDERHSCKGPLLARNNTTILLPRADYRTLCMNPIVSVH